MKSTILKVGDKLIINQDLLEDLTKRGICHKLIWRLGETCKVVELSDYSTVKIVRGIWSTWVTNDLAESMKL